MNGAAENTGCDAVWSGLIRNSALALICRFITAAAAYSLIPFIIRQVGVDGYGIWETIASIGMIMFLVQNVICTTLRWWMSQAYGRGDQETLSRAVGIGMMSVVTLLCVMSPVVWVIREPLTIAIKVPSAAAPEVSRLLAISVTLCLVEGINEVLGSLETASQRMGEALLFQTFARVINFVCVIGLLLAGYGLASMVAGQAIGGIVNGVFLVRAIRSQYPAIRLRPLLPTRAELSTLYRYAGFMAIGGMASLLREQTDKLILALCASPAWVGYYGIAIRLASLLLDVNRFFSMPFIAASGALHARGDWYGIVMVFRRVLTGVAVCSGIIFIVVMGGYDRLIFFWLGRSVPQVTEILLLLVFGNCIAVILAGPQAAFCRGIGRPGIETVNTLFSLVFNLICTVLLVVLIGPMGTVYASAGSSVAGAIIFVWLFHRNLDVPVKLLVSAVGSFAVALPVTGILRIIFLLQAEPLTRGAALTSMFLGLGPAIALYLGILYWSGILLPRQSMGFLRR